MLPEHTLTLRRGHDTITIVASPYVNDYEQVRRSWWERLFSRPWTPRVKYKTVYASKVIAIGADTALVSYETYYKCVKEAESK